MMFILKAQAQGNTPKAYQCNRKYFSALARYYLSVKEEINK